MAEILCITGGNKLTGEVRVAGAKNSALPLIIACLLTEEQCCIGNIPDLEDIAVLMRLLRSLGAEVEFIAAGGSASFPSSHSAAGFHRVSGSHSVSVRAADITRFEASYTLVKKMRASFWILGPLLARFGQAQVALPGGDAIGSRPIDLHLSGLSAMGADIRLEHGVVFARAPGGLYPATIELRYPSVGATHQLLMTAALVPGTTVIKGAAREPEIIDLGAMLSAMGAEISGLGTNEITICGREKLSGVNHAIIGDRIEATTYLLSAAVTKGRVTVRGIDAASMHATLEVLRSAGCHVVGATDAVSLTAPEKLTAVSFATEPYPGVATDVQPLLMAAMTQAAGTSRICETVFEGRYGHVAEFRRFGADIQLDKREAVVRGVAQLSAAPVEGLDIRAAAGLVLMGLMAEGVTQVSDIYHLDRGYSGMVQKLSSLGAEISRLPAFEAKEVVWGC